MKPKATLRSFLCIAGSSLLAVSAASADTYYWDSNGDGTAGFGSAAGTWASSGTGNLWSTSPTGDGVGGAAVPDFATTTADDLYIGTPTLAYPTTTGGTNGQITINGVVNANYLYLKTGASLQGTGQTINFSATGSFETTGSTVGFPATTTLTGAGTSMTWKPINNLNITNITSNSAGSTILQTSPENVTGAPGRVIMNSAGNMGVASAPLVFDNGAVRMISGFPYADLSTWHAAHPITFTLNKNAGLDNSTGGSTFTVNMPVNLGTGVFFTDTGGSGGVSPIKLTSSTNTWNEVRISTGLLEIDNLNQLGTTTLAAEAPLRFGSGGTSGTGGTLRIVGTGVTSFGTRSMLTTAGKLVAFDIADAGNTFTVDKELDQTTGTFTKAGLGTLVLIQDNTFTGASTLSGGGTLVLDYTNPLENGSRLSDTAALTLTNSDLTLKNGSHPETVLSTGLTNGGHSHIARDGGSSTINLNAITRGGSVTSGTISFSADSIATTDTNNFGASGINGILGGWATIGDNWAVSANTGAANTAITALASYTTYVDTGGVATTNYLLNGDGTVAAATNAVGSLKITNSANSQSLDLGANNLSITSTSATALGGIMYAGGNDNLYSITGTGRIVPSGGNQELIFAVNTGTLTVSCPVGAAVNSSPLTKSGVGKLVLTATTASTGATRVNQGTLLVNNTSGNGIGSGAVTVYNKAKLGGTGTIGGSTTINDGGGLTFDIITAAGSHDSLDLAATKALAFPTVASGGGSTLTITSTGGTPGTGICTLVTAPGGITGKLPSVVLPVGWTADAPYVDGTSLKINITSTGAGGSPEIDVNQGGDIADGGSKDFGTVTLGSNNSLVFTINNTGTADLDLTGTPLVDVSGTNAADFTVTAVPSTPVAGPGNTTFTVQFAPLGTLGGSRNAVLTIDNNDSDEGSFTINVSGTAQTKYEAWALGALFDDDANGDGVKNGLAFLLGAANPTSAVSLPTVTQSGGNLILTFNCLPTAARGSATLKVEHGTNLTGWTATTGVVPDATNAVPDNNVTFVVGAGPVGPPALNSVTATIGSAAAASGKLFGRLNAVSTP